MNARILILEDTPADAGLIRRELEKFGFTGPIRVVSSREDFLSGLRTWEPDVVLSDHHLGQFSGRDALGLLRGGGGDTPFILVTGALDEETAVDYMRSGASDYILKDRLRRLGPAVQLVLDDARRRKALARQHHLLEEVLDADPNLIFVKDYDGRFQLANRAVAELYGTTVDELVGKTDADFNPNADEVEHFLRDDREVMDSGRRKLIPEEIVTDQRTGTSRWLQTVKVPLSLADQDDKLVLGVATDVTPRKELEGQLLQAQKMEAVGRLAGGIAHDFNNVLTTILLHTDFLSEVELDEDASADLESIRSAAQRAAALTRQLLAFSRRQIQRVETLDLNALIEDLGDMLRTLLGEDVRLVVRSGGGLGLVDADPSQMEQVVMNLAINARDAMPEGGRLTIETSNVDLDERYAAEHPSVEPGRYVVVTVSDEGVGIDAETQKHIFEPFFTTKGPEEGTGLGLATVYGIVKQTGGNIWVYSEPGHGTTIKVYLPRSEKEIVPEAAEAADSPALRGSETVLVVEDVADVLEATGRVLRSYGYTALEAPDGRSALDMAEDRGEIDMLLTDTVLPDIPGPRVAAGVRELHPSVTVLYMSGYTDDAVVRQGVRDDQVPFLEKPFTPKTLVAAVRSTLDQTE